MQDVYVKLIFVVIIKHQKDVDQFLLVVISQLKRNAIIYLLMNFLLYFNQVLIVIGQEMFV